MASATKIPSIIFSQWATPSAPNPRLAAPIDSDDTTIIVTSAPLDNNGAPIGGDFLMNVKNSSSYVELIYVPAGGVTGTTFTGCVRGIRPTGTDFTTGAAGFAAAHEQDSPVGFAISAIYENIIRSWMQGTIASGGSDIIIGTDADGTVTVSRSTGAGTFTGFLRWNTANDKSQFSNDGASWVNFDSVAASNLVAVSAADTTPDYLSNKLVSATGGIDFNILNPGANETLNMTVDLSEVDIVPGPLANAISDVTATSTEVNQALDGISANVTFTNLNTLTAGAASNADALHSHQTPALSGVAYEALTAGQAIAELPVEVQWYTQLTEVNTTIGDTNPTRRRAMKIIPTRNITDLTDMYFRGREAVNGATVGNLTVSIQTDSAGVPSGVNVANATATFTQATLRTWTATYATRTATFAGAVSLTAGTTYWLVWSMDATDAANYVILGDASSYDENYLTFTRLTYNLDTATWGSSTTVLPLFFWTNPNVSLGTALCPTDADFGGRTWSFVGFAKANAVALASADYYYDTVPGLTGVPGKTYYISTVAGGITATRPNGKYGNDFAYKVGKFFRDSTGALLFKIQLGQKMIYGINTQTSTTTEKLIIWFAPGLLNMSATVGDSSTAMSNGFYDMNTNNFVSSQGGYDNGTLLYQISADAAGTPSSWQGVAQDVSDIGVSVVHTELSGSEETYYIWCIQE